jgi:hypothetical protein
MAAQNLLEEKHITNAFVYVNDEETDFVSLTLEQAFGEHHRFKLVTDYDILKNDFLCNPLKQISLIGKKVLIELQQGNDKRDNFCGPVPNNKTVERQEYPEKKYYFRLYENKKGDDDLVFSADDLALNSEGLIKLDIKTDSDKIIESEHSKETPHLPRLFYFSIYESKENADKNQRAVFTYPENYGISGKNDKYFVPLHSADVINKTVKLLGININESTKQKLQNIENEQNTKELKKLSKERQFNYFKQLKIAKENQLNKSIGAAAVKIGVAWERKDTKCYCGKEHRV